MIVLDSYVEQYVFNKNPIVNNYKDYWENKDDEELKELINKI